MLVSESSNVGVQGIHASRHLAEHGAEIGIDRLRVRSLRSHSETVKETVAAEGGGGADLCDRRAQGALGLHNLPIAIGQALPKEAPKMTQNDRFT